MLRGSALENRMPDIIRMYVEEKLSPSTIATRIGVEPPTIRRRLHAAGVYEKTGKTGGQLGRREGPKRSHGGDTRMDPAIINGPRVHREPCGFCGVRADFGCKHQGRNIITILARVPNVGDMQRQPVASVIGGGAAGLAPFSPPAASMEP